MTDQEIKQAEKQAGKKPTIKFKVGQTVRYGKGRETGVILSVGKVSLQRRCDLNMKPIADWEWGFGVRVQTVNSKGTPIKQEWSGDKLRLA